MAEQLYLVQVTRKGRNWTTGEICDVTSYHSGGRGNGAHAGVYRKDQLNRIIGRYPKGSAKAVPVAVGFTDELTDRLMDDQLKLLCLEGAGVDNWQGFDDAMDAYEQGKLDAE